MNPLKQHISKILAPVDGSENAHRALSVAIAFAQSSGAELILLEIAEILPSIASFPYSPVAYVSHLEKLKENSPEERYPELAKSDLTWKRRVEQGAVADIICRVAEEEGCNLIVLGSRGLSAIERFLLGSVSSRVIHHAHCSVIVIR